jgi:hypothetical protein
VDSDPSFFIIDLQDANKKLIFLNKFSCILLFEGTFTSFSKDKKLKRSVSHQWCDLFYRLLHSYTRHIEGVVGGERDILLSAQE